MKYKKITDLPIIKGSKEIMIVLEEIKQTLEKQCWWHGIKCKSMNINKYKLYDYYRDGEIRYICDEGYNEAKNMFSYDLRKVEIDFLKIP